MPIFHCTDLYKGWGPIGSTAVDEEVLTLLTIWTLEQGKRGGINVSGRNDLQKELGHSWHLASILHPKS